MTGMRISQLAERSGVPASTLRFYEKTGLLPAARTAAGYRVYGEDAVAKLAFIRAVKQLGLPLEDVSAVLAVWTSGSCADVQADLRPRIAARIAGAEQRAAELTGFAATLHRVLQHLDTLPSPAEPCDARCGFHDRDRWPSPPPPELSPRPPGGERWQNAPVACSLDAESAGDRIAEWRRLLAGAGREEIPGGARLTLPAARAGAVAALAAAEQQCCPFFGFRIDLDGPVLHLEVRAPADGAGVLAALFA